ncbi:DsrE/DsrF/DrsH-like family protein [Clostridium estertheticum]|uniref:Sulfide reductase n=1 Tax=Clostridium estertheticum TaxID=238834 RepID=A0A7Y3SY83_9CLOT|nr:DsrE/DsrF/DrsH-like family protein [Clostridium estertheticum]MBW9171944.1 DsrE/DsrF/DrsH-like family protein [Clostridium estertheticum]MBX4266917.1 DsrE/DsrF/DrsH-like family protein [Clostridium estertheticum]MBX4271240.1 DsrE/DsrF/DrsH-like family protein [Clostridium estertheticum]NNU77245.1 sulfide reductase [Clostridium estertheticum]WBL45683.1 DsrE/DsrF/DrsH-like family protein [Clostridium estertheticum]
MDKKLSLIMFSGEYDKALAGLILANSAKELGMEVSMFFAFWGLLLLRDPDKIINDGKSSLEKLMGAMTPKGPEELPLSNMNFSGFGKKMLEVMMKEDGTPTLSKFLEGAVKKGVKFYGCKLSMEVMGLKKEELIPELEVIEAKDYLKDALESDIQLFI